MKLDLIIEAKNSKPLFINCNYGSVHEFKSFKDNKLVINNNKTILADLGYISIQKIHKNSMTPIKKQKNKKLTDEDKKHNKLLNSIRNKIEHFFCKLKKFRILAEIFKGKIKNILEKIHQIASVICGLYCLEFEKT